MNFDLSLFKAGSHMAVSRFDKVLAVNSANMTGRNSTGVANGSYVAVFCNELDQ